MFKVDSPHCILHIELILEGKRDRFWAADDKQIVRHPQCAVLLSGSSRARTASITLEKFSFRFPGFCTAFCPDIFLIDFTSLCLAMIKERFERFLDRIP